MPQEYNLTIWFSQLNLIGYMISNLYIWVVSKHLIETAAVPESDNRFDQINRCNINTWKQDKSKLEIRAESQKKKTTRDTSREEMKWYPIDIIFAKNATSFR